MEIDIRTGTSNEVNIIRVSDCNKGWYIPEVILRDNSNRVFIKDNYIEDGEECADPLLITDKGHALNIIKGINKAIELGWLK